MKQIAAVKKKELERNDLVMRPERLIRFVKQNSPFYRELYGKTPDIATVRDLPVVVQDKYWEANKFPISQILTGPLNDGIVLRSGGTTGNPKSTVYSKKEWEFMTRAHGECFALGVLNDGDRVANLFFSSGMNASFVFTTMSMCACPLDILQVPVPGRGNFEELIPLMQEFNSNVLIGPPATIMQLAERVSGKFENFDRTKLKKILFAGEPFFKNQVNNLKNIFPNVAVASLGYGSTDAGMMGYVDSSCQLQEFRVFGKHLILEILDEETHEVIEEEGRVGIIVVTNLYRLLQPIVRYPVGDRGMWAESKGLSDRKFKLLGRSNEAARIGIVKFYVHDVNSLLDSYRRKLKIVDFQLIVINSAGRDGLILKIVCENIPSNTELYSNKIISQLMSERPFYEEYIKNSRALPIEIKWTTPSESQKDASSAKTFRVLDKRFG